MAQTPSDAGEVGFSVVPLGASWAAAPLPPTPCDLPRALCSLELITAIREGVPCTEETLPSHSLVGAPAWR